MALVAHQQPRSLYGAAGLYNQNVGHIRTIHEKEMCVARSRERTSPSWKEQNNRCVVVSKPPSQSSWWNDKDMKRKRRVAKYKLYATEGRLKSSLWKGLSCFKITCKKIVT
uniref:Uncharacterized protein LOC105851866 n=1 Tax=Cicer arietinum TaxID=3827 RepID=A0A1S3E3C3_CICAR|nr:uncharacterized protein LOC105851866 [Cicer arietinum]